MICSTCGLRIFEDWHTIVFSHGPHHSFCFYDSAWVVAQVDLVRPRETQDHR